MLHGHIALGGAALLRKSFEGDRLRGALSLRGWVGEPGRPSFSPVASHAEAEPGAQQRASRGAEHATLPAPTEGKQAVRVVVTHPDPSSIARPGLAASTTLLWGLTASPSKAPSRRRILARGVPSSRAPPARFQATAPTSPRRGLTRRRPRRRASPPRTRNSSPPWTPRWSSFKTRASAWSRDCRCEEERRTAPLQAARQIL